MCIRLFLFVVVFSASGANAAQEQWVPRNEGYVTDIADRLSVDERNTLSDMLSKYERETRHQYVILTVPSTHPESIDAFSLRVANAWKIGRKTYNDGVMIVWAASDRKLRIELGSGMEAYISNEFAKKIITETMAPSFREGRYAEGLKNGMNLLMIEGRKFSDPESKRRPARQ